MKDDHHRPDQGDEDAELERLKRENVRNLEDTLSILAQGQYEKDGTIVPFTLSQDEMRNVRVFFPKEIRTLEEPDSVENLAAVVRRDHTPCETSCEDAEAFTLAQERYQSTGDPRVLVLNMGNPVHPGGCVRLGANGPEERMCRRSSLLLSLENTETTPFYDYNWNHNLRLGTDAVMISPDVVVCKDEEDELLNHPFTVSVMTCAAIHLGRGMEGMSQSQYEARFFSRITGMLRCAAYLGYENLVLGAFGGGIACNDAAVTSDIFRKAIDQFTFRGAGVRDLFSHIDFAVLRFPGQDYDFQQYFRNFGV